MSEHAPIIITGANIGLGYDTARALLEANPNQPLILAVRDVKRGQIAARQLANQTGASAIEVRALDLASLLSIRRFVKDLGADKAFKSSTGQYYEKLSPIAASSLARDIEKQAQLWAVSAELTGLA